MMRRHKAKKYEISIYHQWTILGKFLILNLIFSSSSLHGNWNLFWTKMKSLIMLVSNTFIFWLWPIKCITQLSITRYNLSDMRRLYERRYIFVVLLREKIFTIRIFSFFFIFSLHWIFKIEILDFPEKKFFVIFSPGKSCIFP